jgi:hypothetical protein
MDNSDPPLETLVILDGINNVEDWRVEFSIPTGLAILKAPYCEWSYILVPATKFRA